MSLKEFGRQIRAARRAQGVSQHVIAAKLRMSRATISAIENGTVGEIGIRKYMALCATLGLSLQLIEQRRPTLADLRKELRDEQEKRR